MFFHFVCIYFLWAPIYSRADTNYANATRNTRTKIIKLLPNCLTADSFSKYYRMRVVPVGYNVLILNWDKYTGPEWIERHGSLCFWWRIDGEILKHDFSNCDQSGMVDENKDQFRIFDLKENTSYMIIIKFHLNLIKKNQMYDQLHEKRSATGARAKRAIINESATCFMRGKTSSKTYSFPAKPDFHFRILHTEKYYFQPSTTTQQASVRIDWFPCGKKGFCQEGETAGTHFSIKFRMLNSKQTFRITEYNKTTKLIYGLLPGEIYEVIVTSILENFQVDSDPQEIFIKPYSSSVRDARIISLSNSSIMIFWKPPQSTFELQVPSDYLIFYGIAQDEKVVSKEYPYKEYVSSHVGFEFEQSKISSLMADTRYTFYIIPRFMYDGHDKSWNEYYIPAYGWYAYGQRYQIDYFLEIYKNNVPLANPEFGYKFENYSKYGIRQCNILIKWLPCGRKLDCKNMKPGSYFYVKYKAENKDSYSLLNETNNDWTQIGIKSNQMYKLSVVSVDGSRFSESKVKEIKTPNKCG